MAVWCIAALVAVSHPASGDALPAPPGMPPGKLPFRVFGRADGLNNLVIASMVQDPRGALWLGTDDGVYRFDGAKFTQFSTSDGLTSSATLVVGLGPDGEPCVGAKNGIVCWNGVRFSRTHAGVPEVPVRAIATNNGALWVGTDAGLYVDTGGGLTPAPGWPTGETVRAMWADATGLIVGGDQDVRWSSGDGRWQAVAIPRERIDGVLRDRVGAIWIRTAEHVWRLPAGTAIATDVSKGLPTLYDSIGVASNLVVGSHGEVLVATDRGIASWRGDHWRLVDRVMGLPNASVNTLLVDRDGTTWIGSKGLVQLRGRGLVERFDESAGVIGEGVWAFQRDRRGQLWFGTSHCLERVVNGAWSCLPGTEGRFVRTFAFPPQGGVFVGGAPSDLLYVDDGGHTTSIGEVGQEADHNLLALAMAPTGDLWVGTKHGLFRLPGAVPGPLEHVVVPGTPADARFASLTMVGRTLWTGVEAGVLALDLDTGRWRRFGASDGFRSSGMRYVIARADSRLCAAYIESLGVTCFRTDGTRVWNIENIGISDGLPSGMAYFLGEDRRGRLWVGTGNGVGVVTPRGIDVFDESDGISGNDSTANAFLVDPDGAVWLGSTTGASRVLAQTYAGPVEPPHTAIVNGRLGDLAIRDGITTLEVDHDRNALTVELAASSLADPTSVEFQVRLSPLETEWSSTRQREARYPALLPGSYQLEVRSRIGAGAWGPTNTLDLVVRPAWWQTRWFLAVAIALGISLVAGAFTVRQRVVLRRRTRQLNQQAEASFHAVLDLMPDLISAHRDGVLVYLNRAQRRLLGVSDDESSWRDVQLIERIHPDDRQPLLELFRRVRDHGTTDLVEVRLRGGDGSWRMCEVSGVLVDIGGLATVVGSGRDVTERNRLRSKVLVSDRMASLGTLAAGIAHEINNPLTYVMGNLEIIDSELEAAVAPADIENDPDRIDLSAVIHDARDGAERVRKIVMGLRAFSRSEEETRRPLDLHEVLESAMRLTGNEIRHRAKLVRELGPVPSVLGDDGQLTQVFINLLVNAAHAIPDGNAAANCITVRTRTDELGRAVVEIDDTGAGMDPEVEKRAFDPFFTTKAVGEGTGLGLSICHGIIAGLDGQIAVDSARGRGTTVRVVLPPHADTAPVRPASSPSAFERTASPRRQRVLIVEDEPQISRMMERMLGRDYDISCAPSGQAAIDLIARETPFDAIISDVMMPNMTGIELVDHLQRVAPEQVERVIFVSGGVFAQSATDQLDRLARPLLHKPVRAADLRDTIRRVAVDPRSR